MTTNHYDASIPIYIQLMDQMRIKIFTNVWAPGEKIPAVRELALLFSVNPNTMQRALTELEREELLHSERTSGRFVTQDMKKIASARKNAAADTLKAFVENMKQLGYTKEEILQDLKEVWSS